ncbi:hypothetical protein E2562_026358, partial [Oryza meyeriana var. granulata]
GSKGKYIAIRDYRDVPNLIILGYQVKYRWSEDIEDEQLVGEEKVADSSSLFS